jgi:hypothetical protein
MRRPARAGAAACALAMVLGACTRAPVAVPTASPTPSPVASSSAPSFVATSTPGASRAPAFDAVATLGFARALASRYPSREATSKAYEDAAVYVRDQLGGSMSAFRVRAGRVNGVAARAGTTYNVYAYSPPSMSYDPRAPHLVVGGHLDTVPGTAGANDNGSGVAMVIELSKLVHAFAPKLPVVFVAFGAEERRRQSSSSSQLASGSRAYLDSLSAEERRAIVGAVVLDMVGWGSRVHVLGKGGALTARTLQRARALGIDAFPDTSHYFSDHISFEDRGIPVVWLYGGDDPAFHTPRDVPAHLQRAQVDRIGRLAWDVVRDYEG